MIYHDWSKKAIELFTDVQKNRNPLALIVIITGIIKELPQKVKVFMMFQD